MRLNSIEIENITSLMGKHFIDFEEILKEGELFAITGPTGSGKSSILTAISLALYGKNHKKNLDSKDFVSLGAATASIKLNFETKGNKYCAAWSLKVLKKNGEPIKKPSLQRIVTKDGIAIESTPEEIIGLTFDQFIRSVILNQGQFSKFLVSNFSERRKILERLYSENELSEINKKLREKLSIQKQEIEILTIKLDSSLPYTETEIIEAEQNLPTLKEEKILKQKSYQDLLEIQSQLKDILEFSSKRLQFQEKTRELDKQLIKSNEEVNKYNDLLREKTTAFDKFKLRYSRESEKLKSAITVRNKLENLKEKIESNKEKTRRTSERLKDLNFEIEEKDNQLLDLRKSEELLKENSTLSHLKPNSIELLEEMISKLQSLQGDQRIYLESKEAKERDLQEIENIGKELNIELEKQKKESFSIFETNDVEIFVQSSSEKLEERIHKLNKEILLSEQASERITLLEKELAKINLKDQKTQLEASSKKVQKFENELKRAQEKEKLFKKNQILSGLLDDSIEKSTCSVCTQTVDIELLKEIKIDIENSLETNSGAIDTTSIQELINEESEKLAVLKHEEQSLLNTIKNLQSETEQLKEKTKNSKEYLSELEVAQKEKQTLTKNYKRAQEINQSIGITTQKIQSLREDFKKSKAQISELSDSINHNKKSADVISNEIAKTIGRDFKISELEPLKRDIKQTFELLKIIDQIEHAKSLKISLEKQIKLLLSEKDELDLSTTKSSFELKESAKELEDLTGGINIDVALAELEKERELLEADIKETTKSKTHLETEYARLLTSLDSLKDQITVLENSIISALGNIANIGFKSSSLASSNKETEIFIEKLKSLKTYPETEETIQGLREGYDKLLLQEISIFKEKLEELLSTISKSEEKISLFRSKQAEQTRDKELLIKLTESFSRLNNLADVLGKNKDEFRNFVLGFIEQQLIQNTNLELSKICDGRFGLSQKESTHGHDFFIIDRWNGAMERKVTTLSGGETFLVSLAMALTLAEMTRGQVDIDCFFIDEGFGSLDSDSIEDAFSALMSVRSRGKQIGIISHIRELTSRIPANINLNKSPEGQSNIEYLYN
ncbi:SMC family ATPase [Halobacteriovorax sp. JY17]|uniref:SbcC/MukB-like Walker B domain-containing protein n=1 Tax=Halobacteriovorax sp. JY17 TaxID=2014617 RepID=UPI000C5E61D8|nr:SMC family ATPase [Halobacteriovorax sp. JY17]PIK15792.1 MAG: hypothetical protein CES88_03425 [Halobacteriovorax sp. JY17]